MAEFAAKNDLFAFRYRFRDIFRYFHICFGTVSEDTFSLNTILGLALHLLWTLDAAL